jgi:putative oxidoreductase
MSRSLLYILNEWILRLGLGLLFVYAGVAKLVDLEDLYRWHHISSATQQFMTDIHHFELLNWLDAWAPGRSWDASILIATYLPWLEIFTGLALCLRRLYAGGIAIAGVLSLAFLGAIGSAWWRGLDITCGCFGREVNKTPFASHIALNLVMLAAAAALAGMEWRRVLNRGIFFP